jgi:hypothetical protein
VDEVTGKQLGVKNFWFRNHEALQLCFDGDVPNDEINCRFKVMRFAFGISFTTSIALMFQSLSIGASQHTVADTCIHNSGGTHILSNSVTQTGGGGVFSAEFSNAGGKKVVMLCTAFKLVEGVVANKLNEAFKHKRAPDAYLLSGSVLHGIGFVMALVLGVYNPDNDVPEEVKKEYVQRYCDEEDPGPGLSGDSLARVYLSAILYTMVAGWFAADNIKLALKYYIGAWFFGKASGREMQIELVTSGGAV